MCFQGLAANMYGEIALAPTDLNRVRWVCSKFGSGSFHSYRCPNHFEKHVVGLSVPSLKRPNNIFSADFYACMRGFGPVRTALQGWVTSQELCRLLLAPRHPSTCSSGRVSAVEVDEAIRQAQPRAVPTTACCTVTARMHHHLRAQPDLAARQDGGPMRHLMKHVAGSRPRCRWTLK